MRKAAGFVCVLVSTLAAQSRMPAAQDKPANVLRISSWKSLDVPSVPGYDLGRCDERGDLYFHAGENFNETLIFKIDHGGSDHKLFKLPQDLANGTAFVDFWVTPDGKVWTAYEAKDGFHVARFGKDGSVEKSTKLDLPEGVRLNQIASFPDGATLAVAHYGDKADPSQQGKSYIAIFDPSGALRQRLNDDTTAVSLKDTTRLQEGGAAMGIDGNLYLLRPNFVLVLSPWGQLLKKLRFDKPSPDSVASRIDAAGSLISVLFLTRKKEGPLGAVLVLLNSMTGEEFRIYKPEGELNNVACFTKDDGYTFYAVENGRVKLGYAPLH